MAIQGTASRSRPSGRMVAFMVAAVMAVALAVLVAQATALWRTTPGSVAEVSVGSGSFGTPYTSVGGGWAGAGYLTFTHHGPGVPLEYKHVRSRLTLRELEALKSGPRGR